MSVPQMSQPSDQSATPGALSRVVQQQLTQKFSRRYESGDELEIRLKRPGKMQGLNAKMFQRAREAWVTEADQTPELSMVHLYPDMRMVYTGVHMLEPQQILNSFGDAEAQWESKTKKLTYDIREYGIRLALASESQLAGVVPDELPNLTRYRTRYSVMLDEFIRLDLTMVRSVDWNEFQATQVSTGRLSYEVELELLDPRESTDASTLEPWLEALAAWSEVLWFVCHDSPLLYQSKEYNNAEQLALSQFGARANSAGVRQLMSKPRGMKEADLVADGLYGLGGPSRYYITPKVDGVRALLIVDQVGVWLYYPPTITKLIKRQPSVVSLVLDGEYMEEKNVYVPFDLLGFEAQGSRFSAEEPYHQRLESMKTILDQLQFLRDLPLTIDQKPFLLLEGFDTGEGQVRLEQFLAELQQYQHQTDGYVFTPADLGYVIELPDKLPLAKRVLNQYPDIVKLKPTEQLTIDLLTRVGPEGELLNLQTYSDRDNLTMVDFYGTDYARLSLDMVDDPDGLLAGLTQPTVVEYQPFDAPDGTLRLKAFRVRDDKTTPNSEAVALDNWNSILNPIAEKQLIHGSTRAMRAPVAELKQQLYQATQQALGASDWLLVEVGAGNGGDINRWVEYSAGQVLAIEPNPEFGLEMRRRLRNHPDLEVTAITAGLEDPDSLNALTHYSQAGYPMVMSSMLSSSFFSDSDAHRTRMLELMTQGGSEGPATSVTRAQFYAITVEGLEQVLGERSEWEVGATYEVYPALITIVSRDPPTIDFELPSALTLVKQREYPLSMAAVQAYAEAQGLELELIDQTAVLREQTKEVNDYLTMYQAFTLLIDRYTVPYSVGDRTAYQMATSGLLRSAIQSSQRVTAAVTAVEAATPELRQEREFLDRFFSGQSPAELTEARTRLDQLLTTYQLGLVLLDSAQPQAPPLYQHEGKWILTMLQRVTDTGFRYDKLV